MKFSNSARLLAGALLLLAVPGSLKAAAPFLIKTNLFESDKGGYWLYRIPGIVVTPKGVILAYCEARKIAGDDYTMTDIVYRRSTDGGKTWKPPQKVADVPGPKTWAKAAPSLHLGRPNDVNYSSPVAITDRISGAVHLLFCLDCSHCFCMRSDDDAASFGEPVEITPVFNKFRPEYEWTHFEICPGHGIQLKNGRLLVPVYLSPCPTNDLPSETATIFSDDHGKTWRRGDIAISNSPTRMDPNETAAVQLVDGRVMLNTRCESANTNRRLVTLGADGSTGWSKPRFAASLPDPICMASMLRLSARPESDKNRILFCNPDNMARAEGQILPAGFRDRINETVKMSYDEGQTWPVHKSLDAAGGYSDLAVLPDGTLLCFYERGAFMGTKHPTGLLTVARFNLEWLTDGADSLSRQSSK